MIISKINTIFSCGNINNVKITHNQDYKNQFGLRMSSPLNYDTISFQSTPKAAVDKAAGVSIDTARRINKAAQPYQTRMVSIIEDIFDDLIATERKPNNPIKTITNRVKTPLSIKEKSQTRQWNNTAEIMDFMQDLHGSKIVLRVSDRNVVDAVLDRLIPEIKSRRLEVVEIENKRFSIVKGLPESKASKFDYASIDKLQDIITVQEDVWNGKGKINKKYLVKQNLTNDYTDNYCAIHFILKFPLPGREARYMEFQVMGADVSDAKHIDDLVYKILGGKEVEGKYNRIVDILLPLRDTSMKFEKLKAAMKEENPDIDPDSITYKSVMLKTKDEEFKKGLKDLIAFNKYRSDLFLFQRKKEPSAFSEKQLKSRFLPLSSDIDPRLDFNNLADEIYRADLIAQKASKAKEKAKKS